MGKMWVHAEIRMEGFVEVDWPNGQSQGEVCQEAMEGDLQAWMAVLQKAGITSFDVTPALESEALAFQETVAILTKPHDPKDFVKMKRPGK